MPPGSSLESPEIGQGENNIWGVISDRVVRLIGKRGDGSRIIRRALIGDQIGAILGVRDFSDASKAHPKTAAHFLEIYIDGDRVFDGALKSRDRIIDAGLDRRSVRIARDRAVKGRIDHNIGIR